MRRFLLAAVLVAAGLPGAAQPPPALLAVLVDTSGSVGQQELVRTREIVEDTLGNLPPGTEVAVYTFDDQAKLVLPRTSSLDSVQQVLRGLRCAGHSTALSDAVYDAARYLRESGVSRRAILLVTDGHDERSTLELEDGIRAASEGNVPVFAIGVGKKVEERVLRRIAKLTGGEYLAPSGQAGQVIAAAILALSSHADVAPAPPRPSPTPTPAPVPSAPSLTLAGVVAGILLLLVAAAGLLAVALRRPAAVPARPAAAGPSALDDNDLPPTLLGRAGPDDEGPRTVVLQERPVLVVTWGYESGRVQELGPDSAVFIGRARNNDLVLVDEAISSQHCRVRFEQGRWVLHDLSSTNGTLVNDARVTRHVLREGDVIRLGETKLEFRTARAREGPAG